MEGSYLGSNEEQGVQEQHINVGKGSLALSHPIPALQGAAISVRACLSQHSLLDRISSEYLEQLINKQSCFGCTLAKSQPVPIQ